MNYFVGATTDAFCEIPCLTELSAPLDGRALRKKWFKKLEARHLGQGLQKFVSYNNEWFNFLGVRPFISGFDDRVSLRFTSGSFIGAIPLRAPDSGKQIGDFVVSPRFFGKDRFGDYIQILDLLGKDISPEFMSSTPLVSGRIFRPPMYLEAVKFIAVVEKLLRRSWRKFDNVNHLAASPLGQVNWNAYAEGAHRIENQLRFPSKRNILNELHSEYGQVRFVFDLCRDEILSSRTPATLRNQFAKRIGFIEEKLYLHRPVYAAEIPIRSADSPVVKECKLQANRILNSKFIDGTAWRVDFNDVFEKFVQHIFKEYAPTVGGKLESNPRIRSNSSMYYGWELRQLEPDAVLRTDNFLAFIDAKYKSHLYNRFEASDSLKEEYRRDLHQVLAYTTFTSTGEKLGIVCYPSNELLIKTTRFRNPYDDCSNTILIVGIPLKRDIVSEAVTRIGEQLDRLFRPQL